VRTGTILIFLIFISISCRYQEGERFESIYFSLDSLVDAQISQLILLSPGLEKEAILDSEAERTFLQLDSMGWENELRIFREANIDKPAYLGSYLVNTEKKDEYSNLLYDEYLPSDSEKLVVKRLRIYYLDTRAKIRKLEVILNDKNELFESDRQLSMTFEDRNRRLVLSSYHVRGNQKLKMNQVVNYEVSSNLNY
jgi:hypothetical protein